MQQVLKKDNNSKNKIKDRKHHKLKDSDMESDENVKDHNDVKDDNNLINYDSDSNDEKYEDHKNYKVLSVMWRTIIRQIFI